MTDDESCPLGLKAKHLLASCPVYQGETINQRWEVVRENRICWKCLEVSHHRNDYKRADGTLCDKCKENHFRSLHNETKNEPSHSNMSPYAPTFTSQGTPPGVENCNIRGRDNEETKDVNYFPGNCPVLKVRSEAATEHSALICHVVQRLEHESPIQKSCKTTGDMLSAYASANEPSIRTKEGRNVGDV